MNILITGANGQLGTAFRDIAPANTQHQFYFKTRSELDILDAAAITAAIKETGVTVLVNCAAYTAVDKAETEKETAFAINGEAPGLMAKLCADLGVRLVHISTDYVFNGDGEKPYREDDPIAPVNIYGASKQAGEAAVLANNKDAVIIRTAWVYAPFGNNFVKTMLRLMNTRPEIGVVADQHGSPTNALDLAAAIVQLIDSGNWQGGIYHYCNEGVITWYDFALAIRELSGLQCTINPLTTEQYPTPAKRPRFSVMDTSKIQQVFGLQLQPWRSSLAACIQRLQQEESKP